jgi:8-oxo-dGTP pyrophosphatase MutT (NUDIX family)
MTAAPAASDLRPSASTLRARVAAASAAPGRRGPGLAARAAGLRGDHDLDPALRPAGPLVPAAVLVPVVDGPDGLAVLLTRRTAHLNAHAGQISFPGGRFDPEDADAAACALRESQEEIGLDPARVEILGRLDTYLIRTGYRVTPVVGLVTPPLALRADPFEVEEIFQVPLDFVIDPRNRERRSRDVDGTRRDFWAIPYGGYFIWGATAGMLVNLSDVLLGQS